MARRVWPTEDLNLRLVTASHFYYTVWQELTAQERGSIVQTITRYPENLGIAPALRERFPAAGGRKRKVEKDRFTTPEDAAVYIERIASEHRHPEKWRAALYLMYTCGMSPGLLVTLSTDDFVEMGGACVLVTGGYLYVLTPTVREIVERWLAITPTPERVFSRMRRPLAPHEFLTSSYALAKSN